MIRQLKHSRVLRELWPGEMRLAYAGHGQEAAKPRRPPAASTTTQLPRRPDASALSEAIPLFYIGRNKSGLWVVRERPAAAEACSSSNSRPHALPADRASQPDAR